jgi:hypothetical protein
MSKCPFNLRSSCSVTNATALIEIGHNIGLAHSGETATYDDQTGMVSSVKGNICTIEPTIESMLTSISIDGIQLR